MQHNLQLKDLLPQKQFVVEQKEDWKVLGEEMSDWYGRPMYSTVNKFKNIKSFTFVANTFAYLKEKGDKTPSHLYQKLHHS